MNGVGLALGLALTIGMVGRAPALEPAPAAPGSFAAAVSRAMPFVVGVYALDAAGEERPAPVPGASGSAAAERSDADRDDGERVGSGPRGFIGAGIVLRADGVIATAAHVIAGAKRVVVKLADERIRLAEVIAVDNDADIALLRVPERWPSAPPLGHSVRLRPGDWVLAIGEPFALQRSVLAGVVGGPARHFAEDPELVFIQSGIGLNPGHSGGPLLDADGAIVGMNARAITGPYGAAGMSLAVPIELVQRIAAELLAGRRGARPRFDAVYEDLLPPQALAAGLTRAAGAALREVRRDGVAARAGLRAGDIVVGIDGQPVSDSADLALLLLERDRGLPLRLTVFRDRAYRELKLP